MTRTRRHQILQAGLSPGLDQLSDDLSRQRQRELSALRAEVALLRFEFDRRRAITPEPVLKRMLAHMNGESLTVDDLARAMGDVDRRTVLNTLAKHPNYFSREHFRPGPGKPQRYRKVHAAAALLCVALFTGCQAPRHPPSSILDPPPLPAAPTVAPKYPLDSLTYPLPAPARTNVTVVWTLPAGVPMVWFESSTNLTDWTYLAWSTNESLVVPVRYEREYFKIHAVPHGVSLRIGPGVPQPPDL